MLYGVNGEIAMQWAVISDPQKYVMDVLASEAGDVPDEKIHQGNWVLDTVSLDDIRIDQRVASDHENDPLHTKRRDGFVASITAGKEIKPLIVLGDDLFLVDGYARYRAMKLLNVKRVRVLRQKLTDK